MERNIVIHMEQEDGSYRECHLKQVYEPIARVLTLHTMSGYMYEWKPDMTVISDIWGCFKITHQPVFGTRIDGDRFLIPDWLLADAQDSTFIDELVLFKTDDEDELVMHHISMGRAYIEEDLDNDKEW